MEEPNKPDPAPLWSGDVVFVWRRRDPAECGGEGATDDETDGDITRPPETARYKEQREIERLLTEMRTSSPKFTSEELQRLRDYRDLLLRIEPRVLEAPIP